MYQSLIGTFLGDGKQGPTRATSTLLHPGKWYIECRCNVVEKINCGHQGVDEQPLLDEIQEFGNARNVSFARGASRHRVWRTNDDGHRALQFGFTLIGCHSS